MNKRLTLLFIAFSMMILSGCSMLPTGSITQGVYINDQNVSGLSRDEVTKIVTEQVKSSKPGIVLVDDTGKKTTVSGDAFGFKPNIDTTVTNAFAVGYESNVFTMLTSRVKALFYPVHIHIAYDFNEPQAEVYLKEYGKKVIKESQDAYFTIENGKLVPHKEVVGKTLLIKETYNLVKEAVLSNTFGEIKIAVNVKAEPKVTLEKLKAFDTILASYTTNYDSSAENRSHNIILATDKINGTVLQPGEVFSFNNVVGERSAEAGYDDAPVMVNGKLVPGIGGGICQVSSTLFNGALLSGMEIVERTPHYAPVSYIEIGRDATVSYGSLDFQFKNVLTMPVYIWAYAEGGTLTIYVLGNHVDALKSVNISVSGGAAVAHGTVHKTDASIKEYKVEEGHDGLTVNTYRSVVYANGTKRDETFESYYDPTDTVIINEHLKPKSEDKKDDAKSIDKKDDAEKNPPKTKEKNN